MKILYISPFVAPAVGGAAEYLKILSRELTKKESVDEFVIVTEKHPDRLSNQFGRKIKLLDIFPFRAGRIEKTKWSYLQYLYQNIQFLRLKTIITLQKSTHVIVHGYFHTNYNFVWFILRRLKKQYPSVQFILDLRDPKIKPKRDFEIKHYDKIIACSENIRILYQKNEKLYNKIKYIPIMVEAIKRSSKKEKSVLDKYNLERNSYFFNASGIYNPKGSQAQLDIISILWEEGIRIPLVIAGRNRDWSSKFDKAQASGQIVYLGMISHEEATVLGVNSLLDLNNSNVDSVPRHSLEVYASGGKVFIPANIPELYDDFKEYVCTKNAKETVEKIMATIESEQYHRNYDIAKHFPKNVIEMYVDYLSI